MAGSGAAEYLPDDPRYGLKGEDLAAYYRAKPAQWAIYCWDKVDTLEARGTYLQDQRLYVSSFGERVIGYGHLVTDDGLDTLGTTFFMQLDDREATEQFLADEPLNKAGVYETIEVRRWSNSFQKRAADYRRKGLQQFLCTGSKIADPAAMIAAHLHAHETYFKDYADSFIFRGPIRSADGADNIGTALLLELPDRAAAEDFWNNEPFAANGGYQDDARIYSWVFGD
ncbi:MAG: YciI family protein [Alphaproteobacteria bacterium]